MNKGDRISSIVLIVFSIVICFASFKMGLGTIRTPGSGFLPFFCAVFIGLFSLPTLVKSILEQKLKALPSQEPISLRKVIRIILGLILYTLFLGLLGFKLSTFLFMLFLFRGIETIKWKWAVLFSISAVLFSYLVFDIWLQTMLPKSLILERVLNWSF
jgi:hypothetical protein